MWVTPDDLYVLAVQNAVGDRNSISAHKSGHLVVQALLNSNAASKTFKPIIQYYYVVLCELNAN